jgi:hypothetical protein
VARSGQCRQQHSTDLRPVVSRPRSRQQPWRRSPDLRDRHGALKLTVAVAVAVAVAVVKRPDNLHVFKVLPRRWVVEQTLAWITRYRRAVRDYELAAHHETMIYWAMIAVMALKNYLANTAASRPVRLRQIRSFFRNRSPGPMLATAAPWTSPWLPPGYEQNFWNAA